MMRSGKIRLVFAAVLTFAAAIAAAEIPRETLERLADIQVRTAEITHLQNIGKLTSTDYNREWKALRNEEETL